MNVVLVYPRFMYPAGDFSLGLASVASYLRKMLKVRVSICDTTFHPTFSYVESFLKERRPVVCGIYSDTIILPYALKTADIAKSLGADVILGGPHPTILPDSCLKHPSVDGVCIGEGEETFSEVVERRLSGEGYYGVKGLWFKSDGEVVRNPRREPIAHLDSLPYPAVDLFEIERYVASFVQLDSYNSDISGISLIASRGCPFSCTYCQPTLSTIFGKRVRIRSPENVVGEIKELIDRYKIEGVFFQDDTLTVFRNWLFSFCDLLDKENIRLLFGLNTRADTTDIDLLKRLKEAGLVKVKIGIETITDRIRNEVYRKKVKREEIKNLLSWCKELGIQTAGYFMLGGPTESAREVWSTIRFATFSSLIEANFSVTTPLPETVLYDIARKRGWRLPKEPSEFDYYQVKRPKMARDEIGTKTLIVSKKLANIVFYLYPARLFATLRSIFTKRGVKKLFIKLRRI